MKINSKRYSNIETNNSKSHFNIIQPIHFFIIILLILVFVYFNCFDSKAATIEKWVQYNGSLTLTESKGGSISSAQEAKRKQTGCIRVKYPTSASATAYVNNLRGSSSSGSDQRLNSQIYNAHLKVSAVYTNKTYSAYTDVTMVLTNIVGNLTIYTEDYYYSTINQYNIKVCTSHTYGGYSIITDATCTSAGQRKRTCSRCGYVEYSNIAAKGHDYSSKTVNDTYKKSHATCTSPAVYYYKCTRCSAKGSNTYTNGNSLGHNFNDTSNTGKQRTAATCTAAATYWKKCTRCNTYSTTAYFSSGNALGHNFTDTTNTGKQRSAATCTAAATYWKKCTRCNTYSTSEYFSSGNALGHDFTVQDPSSGFLATSATCTEAATYYYKCSRCGTSSKGNTNTTYSHGNPLGHTATTWESDLNQHWQICTRCKTEFNRDNHIDANKDGKCDACQRLLTVTVTFDANGGTIDGAATKTYTWVIESQQTPPAPTRKDYKFVEWEGWTGTVPVTATTYKAIWKGMPPTIEDQPNEVELIEYFDVDESTYKDSHSKNLTGVLDYNYAENNIIIKTKGGSNNDGSTNRWTWYLSSDKTNWIRLGDNTMSRKDANGMTYTASYKDTNCRSIILNLNYVKRNVNSYYYKAIVSNDAGSIETTPIKLTVYWLPVQSNSYTEMITGKEFNEAIKSLIDNKGYESEDNVVSQIIPSHTAAPAGVNTVNLQKIGEPILAWAESDPADASKKIIKYYFDSTKAGGILLSEDCSYMFYNFKALWKADLSGMYSVKTNDFSYFFGNDSTLTDLNVTNIETSAATNMSHMFYNCSALETLKFTKAETSKVKDMSSMFEGCTNLKNFTSRRFVTDSLENAEKLFYGCSNLTYSFAITGANTNAYTEMFTGTASDQNARVVVNYETGCKALASAMVATKTANDHVYLYENYSIAYNLDGGSWNDTSVKKTYSINDYEYTLPTPIKKGYIFTGWTGSNGSTPQKEVTIPAGSIGDRSYMAHWQIINYSITYDLNGGIVSNIPNTYNVESTFIFPVPSKEGYSFDGWTNRTSMTQQKLYKISKGTTGELEMVAHWSLTEYTITYNLNGGTLKNPVSSFTMETPTFKLDNPIREHYEFAGWTSNDITTPTKAIEVAQGTTKNLSFTANWTPIDYTIAYDTAGGTISGEVTTYNADTPGFTLVKPIRNGYRFVGWTGSNGDIPEENVFISLGSYGNKNYIANWELETYTIQYVLNEGSLMDPVDSYTSETPSFILPQPTKLGYTFIGWTGENITSPELNITISEGSYGNRIYYANCELAEYTIGYDLDGGTLDDPIKKYSMTTPTFILPTPIKDGYTFLGWTSDDIDNPQEEVKILLGSRGDKQFVANWEMTDFEILLDYGLDQLENKTIHYNVDSSYVIIENPECEGYEFLGWTGSNGSVPEKDLIIKTGSFGNRIYNANWKYKEYAITYYWDSEDSTIKLENPILTYTIATEDFTLPHPTKENDEFFGWISSTSTMPVKDYVVKKGTTGDLSFTAAWAGTEYNIDYELDGGTISGQKTKYKSTDGDYIPPIPKKDGLVFSGWEPEMIPSGSAGDVTFTASWRFKYTIDYNLDGGTMSDGIYSYAETFDTFTLPQPEKYGYEFLGWTGSNGNIPDKTVKIIKGSSGNKEYKANWEARKFNLNYILNNGTLPNAAETYYTFETPTFILKTPTKDGYAFIGWTEGNDAEPNTTLTIEKGTTGDRTFAAHWKEDEYTIDYKLDGGSVAEAVNTYKISTPTFTLPTPTRNGYTFLGWTGSNGENPEKIVKVKKGSFGNKIYKANWTPINYLITYDLAGGTANNLRTSYTIETDTFVLPQPTKPGYSFLGWSESSSSTVVLNTKINRGTTGNKAFTAKWALINYKITLDYGDHTLGSKTITYNIESEDFNLPETIKDGYQFDGWMGEDISIPTITVTVKKGTIGNKTYTAHWKKIYNQKVMVRYENVDGTFEDYQEVKNENVLPGTEIEWHSDATVEWQAAEVRWTTAETDRTEYVDILKQKYTFDVNGILNDLDKNKLNQTNIKDWATFDVYINGKAVATNVYDYCQEIKYGSKYEIKNIKETVGHKFIGVNNGNGQYASDLSGMVGNPIQILSDIKRTVVVLEFDAIETHSNLITGPEFNSKIKTLAGGKLSTITKIEKSETEPNISTINSNNVISLSDSDFPTYAWFDKGTVYWWSNASTIHLNSNSYAMFYALPELTSVNLSGIDTSNVTNMGYMFSNCSKLADLDISNFNTENVKNMSRMFANCSSLQDLKVNKFNTSKVTDMGYMFLNCKKLSTLDVSNFDTSLVTNMISMFQGCRLLTNLDVKQFNTSNVTNMANMFCDCSSLKELDVSNFDTSKVSNMQYMFASCNLLTELNLNNFNTSKTTNMSYMFTYCQGLMAIDVSSFNTSNVTDMSNMFSKCIRLIKLDLSNFNTSNVTNMNSMFAHDSSLTTIELSDFNTSKVANMNSMFLNCKKLSVLNVSTFDTKIVTNMAAMFQGCQSLEKLNVKQFDTSNVTNMSHMFCDCSSLKELDVSNFKTSKVTNMQYMFASCNLLTELNLNNFDTSKTTNMSYMFTYCQGLTDLCVSSFNTSNVTDMNNMFSKCIKLAKLDLSSFDTSNVTNMNSMFAHDALLASIELSNFNTSLVTNMNSMFLNCKKLSVLDVSNFDTKIVTNMASMFQGCQSLIELNVKQFNTSNVTNMSHMFCDNFSLKELDVSNFDTSKVTNMQYMFASCKLLTELNLNNFNTSITTDMSYMFAYCNALFKLTIDSFNTSQVTKMEYMFAYTNSLTEIDMQGFTNIPSKNIFYVNTQKPLTIINPTEETRNYNYEQDNRVVTFKTNDNTYLRRAVSYGSFLYFHVIFLF